MLRKVFSFQFVFIVSALVLGIGSGVLFKDLYETTKDEVASSDESPPLDEDAREEVTNNDNEFPPIDEETNTHLTTTPTPKEELPTYKVETDDKGKKTASGFYKNDTKVGTWEFFHSNGELSRVGSYKDGIKVGIWRSFYPNGKIMSEGRYNDDGVKVGLWTVYYPNGNRKVEGKYIEGTKVGTWLGFPIEDEPFSYWSSFYDPHGNPDGEWKWYKNGKLKIVDYYQNGKVRNRKKY